MKKIFLALAALATLAACTKSEVTYEPAGEITFSPVTKTITKAMMANENNAFTTTEEFNIWAFYNPTHELSNVIDTWVGQYTNALGNGAKVYIEDKTFAYDNSYSLWAGKEYAYFWPKVGSLAFAGYHPSSASATYTLTSGVNAMTFTDVANTWVSSATTQTEDLMYFNLTTGYDRNNVEAVFKHALSWITVNVATTTATLNAGAKITVSSVKFTEVEPKGTGTVNNQDPISWDVEEDEEGYDEDADNVQIETVESTVTLTAANQVLKEPLLIPQSMAGNLEITYTITSEDNSSFTEKKVIKLNEMKDVDAKDLTSWDPAKHYIYNIVISTNEILIDPKVVDWTPVTAEVPIQ